MALFTYILVYSRRGTITNERMAITHITVTARTAFPSNIVRS